MCPARVEGLHQAEAEAEAKPLWQLLQHGSCLGQQVLKRPGEGLESGPMCWAVQSIMLLSKLQFRWRALAD